MRSLPHPRDESQRQRTVDEVTHEALEIGQPPYAQEIQVTQALLSSRLKGSSNIAKHLVFKLLPCEHVCCDDNANSSIGEQHRTLLSTGPDHCWSDLIYVIFFQRLKWRRLT